MKGRIHRSVALAGLWLLSMFVVIGAHASNGSSPEDDASSSASTVEIKGVVQAMPASGLIGSFTIDGKPVQTDSSTKFDQEDGKIEVGVQVEVKGTKQANGPVLAIRIEVQTGVGSGPGSGSSGDDEVGSESEDETDDDGEVQGTIVSLPADGLLGTWNVAGRPVIVVSTTRLDQEHGALVVGAIVEVNGLPDTSGAIVASKIEVKSGTTGGSVPVPGKVELVGLIEALPANGLIGDWVIGGRTVVVSAATVLDPEHGAFAVGASVEAKGALDTAGNLVAVKIETTAGNGAPVPALEFWGVVTELPASANGFVGVWKVDDKLVNVTPATEINVEDAPLVAGVTVEVHGWLQPDGVIEAKEIETRTVVGVGGRTGHESGRVLQRHARALLRHGQSRRSRRPRRRRCLAAHRAGVQRRIGVARGLSLLRNAAQGPGLALLHRGRGRVSGGDDAVLGVDIRRHGVLGDAAGEWSVPGGDAGSAPVLQQPDDGR